MKANWDVNMSAAMLQTCWLCLEVHQRCSPPHHHPHSLQRPPPRPQHSVLSPEPFELLKTAGDNFSGPWENVVIDSNPFLARRQCGNHSQWFSCSRAASLHRWGINKTAVAMKLFWKVSFLYSIYCICFCVFCFCFVSVFILSDAHYHYCHHLKQFQGFNILSLIFLSPDNNGNPFFAY